MSFLSGIADFLTGGLGSKIVDTVKDYFPPSMSEQEKLELEFRIKEAAHKQEVELIKLNNEADKEFNKRIAEYEGTANEIKAIPIVGPIMVFLRGAFRPLFAYAIAWIDFNVFSGNWVIEDEKIMSVFWIVNLIVMGFYFGERAVKNLLPVIEKVMKK